MLIDTHCHLNFAAYKDDIDDVVDRTQETGMKIIVVGSQKSTSERALDLAEQRADFIYAAVGLHPIHMFDMEVDESEIPFQTRKEEFSTETYEKMCASKNVVAIGEMGIDYFHVPNNVPREEFERVQKWGFLKGVQLAKKLGLPVIVHTRGAKDNPAQAYEHMLEVLKEADYSNAVVHCYTENWEIAKKILDAGLMISFTGIITYPKTHDLEKVVKNTPLDRMMVETDAPYLAPQIVRGKRNEPRHVRYVADRVAEIKKLTYDEVEEQTGKNAETFFNLK